MPRRPKPLNPYASWTALLGATVRQLRMSDPARPALSQDELGRRISYDGSTVGAIERGVLRPDAKFIDACERELNAGGALQFMLPRVIREWDEWERLAVHPPAASPSPPAELADDPAQLRDPRFLEAYAGTADQGFEGSQMGGRPRLGQGTLEGVNRAVDRLRREYSSIRPAVLLPRAERRLGHLDRLLEGRLTLEQHRDLVVARGWLSLLLAALQFDLGDREAAETSRDAALELGREAEHPEIVAWAFETPAWFALTDGRLRDAVDLARAGQEIAPPDRSVIVATTLQEARAWARLGARREAEHAIRRAEAALARLPEPSHPQDHFVFDPPKLSFYVATCYVWLHEPARAEEHARHVIEGNGDPASRNWWPTRVATARVELALALAQQGRVDEAARIGIDVLSADFLRRSTIWRAGELDRVLRRDHGDVADVEDFHEQYVLVRRSIEGHRPQQAQR
jgi:tetratricopeptide (TPR) repeat protein